MDFTLPMRLLRQFNGDFAVVDPRYDNIQEFDIISYTWGKKQDEHNPGIYGVHWNVFLKPEKIEEIKRLMIESKINYLWCDCVCIN